MVTLKIWHGVRHDDFDVTEVSGGVATRDDALTIIAKIFEKGFFVHNEDKCVRHHTLASDQLLRDRKGHVMRDDRTNGSEFGAHLGPVHQDVPRVSLVADARDVAKRRAEDIVFYDESAEMTEKGWSELVTVLEKIKPHSTNSPTERVI